MAEIPISNTSGETRYVGGKMIPPGETRHIDERLLPPDARPEKAASAAAPAPDKLRALLDQDARLVKREFPNLTDTELSQLDAMEKTGKARRSLLSAITQEQLVRADAKAREAESTAESEA